MGTVNVLVHGLFFMHLSDNGKELELVAPPLKKLHNFLGGVRGQLIKLHGSVSWNNIGLQGNPAPNLGDIKKSILRFNMSETGLGGWKRQNFAGTITLPWPLGFFSIRCDVFDTSFLYDKKFLNIANNIIKNCRGDAKSRVSFITCLQYRYTAGVNIPGWTPGTNLHCYCEPCTKDSVDETNRDYVDARAIFTNGPQFDLQMDQAAGSVITPRGAQCPTVPNGLNIDDDYSLPEDPLRVAQGICKNEEVENISPANCPNFFVGP